MYPDDGKDSIFSTSKPKKVPPYFLPMVIGLVAALVILYNT